MSFYPAQKGCVIAFRFLKELFFGVLLMTFTAAHADEQIHFVPAGMRFGDVSKIAKLPAPASGDELTNAGDFYLLPNGVRVPLLRAKNSIAVSFAPGVSGTAGLAKLKASKGTPAHAEVSRAAFRGRDPLHILRAGKKGDLLNAKSMQSDAAVAYARPVLMDAKTKTRMIPTDEILARFSAGTSSASIRSTVQPFGLLVVGRTLGNLNVYKLRMKNPKVGDPLQTARALAATKPVLWAQPDFVREIRHFYTPPNELFGTQQALQNTGLNHAVAGADVGAVAAWNLTTGTSSVVIAIIDDGVDISHPGLRIFTNPGESGNGRETNGVDDDGDGLIDDVHGWDFANNDNDPTPVGTNGHGTGTAGIAAATFGTQAKTAGIAGGCTILPVKIADDTGVFTTDEIIGDAIIYAARFADVLSNSWGGGSESSYIDDAIDYATTQGRQGRGCPVFFATGNYASTWYQGGGRWRLSTAGLSGNYYYSFYYEKGPTSGGEDAVRIDNVCLLDADGYTHKTAVLPDEDFEGYFFPPLDGWWLATGGSNNSSFWTLSSSNTLVGTGGSVSAVSPALADGQYAWLVTPLMAISGSETFAFASSISIPTDSYLYIPVYDAGLKFVGYYGPFNGVPDVVDPGTSYPASYASSIAVGASTDCDLRSDYSEYAGHLDFVAPSNGGWNDIATLDPVGAVGWTLDDFKMNFGGTSAATPLAAGIAALALSVNPSLTAAQIRTLMHSTCDRIGSVTYDGNGTNEFYGYGRVNAFKAVSGAMFLLDSDGDGMPDYWEIAHGLNPHDPGDAALDSDGDGFTNLQEYLAGTDPWNPNSLFKITGISATDVDVTISFDTVSGKTYRVEYKDSLEDATWLALGSDVPGTGSGVQVTDPGAVTAHARRFYRVRLLQ
jgi:subtilisin family serine protease